MINFDPSKVSFSLLDRNQNIGSLLPNEGDDYPLPTWYRSISEMPLAELSVEDLCKACRQNIHIEYVVPLAVELLKEDVTVGEMFDGEVLVSLKSVSITFWEKHEIICNELLSLLDGVVSTVDNGLSKDIEELGNKLLEVRSH